MQSIKQKRIYSQSILGLAFIFVGGIVLMYTFLTFKNSGPANIFMKPYVVQSGSMEPTIHVGSVILTKKQATYSPFDIVTFAPNGRTDQLVTHRIAARNTDNTYLTSGDANEALDAWTISSNDIIGKVVFKIPYLGYAVNFVQTPKGFVAFVVIPATLIIYEELKVLRKEIFARIAKAIKKKSVIPVPKSHVSLFPKVIVITALVVAATAVFVPITISFLSDIEISTQNLISAAEDFTPQ